MLRQYQSQILREGLQSFGDYAYKYSDCSSARKKGDLGSFGRGKMQKPFEDAAYGLGVGEMTPSIVESDSGVHLIIRTE
jgi:NIMA-interacting peptidyl-prolyl cis-trans isomerase 1